MDADQEPWEIAKELTRKRYMTLNAIRNQGGEARTSEITSSREELYHQLVNDHYSKMIPAGLIEKIDEGSGDAGRIPREGYKYRITERGKKVLSEAQASYDLNPIEEGEVRNRFNDLEARVEKLEQENGQLRRMLYDPHENYDTLPDWVEAIRDNVVVLQNQWMGQD